MAALKSLGAPWRRPSRRTWATLVLLAAVVGAYAFVLVGKPLHIDDPHYLASARHIAEHPASPLTNPVNWKATEEPTYLDNNNPPFYLYLLAGWIAAFGDDPRGLQAVGLGMVALGVVAVLFLARRFTRHPYLATALVFTAPTLPLAVNLMMDVPLMALGVTSVALFVAGTDSDRRGLTLAGAGVAGLAILTKYSGFALLPVLAAYALLRGRRRHLWALALPLAMFSVWVAYNLAVFGELHLLIARRVQDAERHDLRSWWRSLWSLGTMLGSSFLFLGLAALRPRHFWRARTWGPVAALALLAAPPLWGDVSHVEPEYWLFAVNALLLLVAVAAGPWGRRPGATGAVSMAPPPGEGAVARLRRSAAVVEPERLFLGLWVAAVVGFHLLGAHHQAPRYHFLAFAPFTFLLVRFLSGAGRRWRWWLGWGSVAAQAALALVLVAADDVHARGDRALIVAAGGHAAEARPAHLYCLGHWGFQETCAQQGIPLFDLLRHEVQPGDRFLVPVKSARENVPTAFLPLPTGAEICDGRNSLERVDELTYPFGAAVDDGLGRRASLLEAIYRRLPVALMNPEYETSFYAMQFPVLPYSFAPLAEGVVPPAQQLLVLRARCGHDPASDRFTLRVGDPAALFHFIRGWGMPNERNVWSLGPRSSLRFVLDTAPAPYRLRMERDLPLWPPGEQQVAVVLAGEPVGVLEFADGEREASLEIPADRLRRGVNTVDLEYPHTVIPARTSTAHMGRLGHRYLRLVEVELAPLTATRTAQSR